MKKILSVSIEKVLFVCGFSLALTLVGFWHFQSNINYSDKMSLLKEGVGTCFTRVTQTFTAAMIKDFTSPYLGRSFMALSDECLNETLKVLGKSKSDVIKGHQSLNNLISETYWFHEKVLKLTAPIISGRMVEGDIPLTNLAAKYESIETLKLETVDRLDATISKFQALRRRDETLVGIAFSLFMLSLMFWGAKEISRLKQLRAIEREGLSLLNAGGGEITSRVHSLMERILVASDLRVSQQIFKDYQAGLSKLRHAEDKAIDRIVETGLAHEEELFELNFEEEQSVDIDQVKNVEIDEVVEDNIGPVINHFVDKVKSEMEIHVQQEVSAAKVALDEEVLEQICFSAINRFTRGNASQISNFRLDIKGTKSDDFYLLDLSIPGMFFEAKELSYFESGTTSADEIDKNLRLLYEFSNDFCETIKIANQANEKGKVMAARFSVSIPYFGHTTEVIDQGPKKAKRSIISLIRGKKKDLNLEG